MKMMQIDTKVGRAETEAAELLVLTHCEGEPLSRPDASGLDKVLGGSLRDLLQSREFEGRAGEALVYHTHGKVPAKRLLLVGLGKKHQLTLGRDPPSAGRMRSNECAKAKSIHLPPWCPP